MPSRTETFMEVAHVFARRSTCVRGQVGAVLVVDNRIIATGYNGSPPGDVHCTAEGCLLTEGESGCQRAVHAEANAIAFAARYGVRLEGSRLFCTHGPCLKCAQLIVSAGIKGITYETPYRLPDGLNLLLKACIEIERVNELPSNS